MACNIKIRNKITDNTIVVGRINPKSKFKSYIGEPSDITIEAIYAVIRHIENNDINNELITYMENSEDEYIPEYKLTLEKLSED